MSNAAADEVYEAACERLKQKSLSARGSVWLLADELLLDEDLLGDRFSQAAEITQLASGTISNYLSTARAWPEELRNPDLPFDIHQSLNPLETDKKLAVIQMVREAGWNRDDVRHRMAAWKTGDKLAFDLRHRVDVAEPKKKNATQTVAEAAHDIHNDLPVGSSRMRDGVMEVELHGTVVQQIEVKPAAPEPTADKRLEEVLDLIQGMRTDPTFLDSLTPEKASVARLNLEGQWLQNAATHVKAMQDINFQRMGSRKVSAG